MSLCIDRLFARLSVAMLLIMLCSSAMASITSTPHNLSTSGLGSIKASSESEICVFCHTPHNSAPSGALWNRQAPGSNYTPYSSTTAVASPGQPNGASLLCLSCHDGTIALGDVLSRGSAISMQGGVTTMPSGRTRLGTDLSDDHPVSFGYTSTLASQNGELVDPSSLTGLVKLDGQGRLQCTSCHDAHDNSVGKFLVMDNRGGALCETCHQKNNWNQSFHNQSSASWNGSGTDPWPFTTWNTVADNACLNCHQPHQAGGERLLIYQNEEQNCSACHNGNVANQNIMAEFNKSSRHPVLNYTGVHDAAEATVINSRHAECMDCHNPHAVSSNGNPSGPLNGVRGVTIGGSNVGNISNEYELCFRCHGDSPNKPTAPTPRWRVQTNVRLEFNTGNPSYHPVAGPGKNTFVPSLINGLSTNSTIKCTDCHNNNSTNGPNGPHGSIYHHLLERQYITADFTQESTSNYALCYKCHSRDSIRSNESFPLHQRHIFNEDAPCNVCHDPHGISSTQGNSTNNTNLINFDTSVVQASSSGILRFEDLGDRTGRCYLRCHGQNHDPCSYGTGMGGMGGMCGGGMGGM